MAASTLKALIFCDCSSGVCVAFWVELSECVTLDWGAGMHFWGVFTSPRVLLGVTQHLFGVINERDTLLHNAFRYIFHY